MPSASCPRSKWRTSPRSKGSATATGRYQKLGSGASSSTRIRPSPSSRSVRAASSAATPPPAMRTEKEFAFHDSMVRGGTNERHRGNGVLSPGFLRIGPSGCGRSPGRRAGGRRPIESTRARSATTRSGRRRQHSAALYRGPRPLGAVTGRDLRALGGRHTSCHIPGPVRTSVHRCARETLRKLRPNADCFPHGAHRTPAPPGDDCASWRGRSGIDLISAGSSSRMSPARAPPRPGVEVHVGRHERDERAARSRRRAPRRD